MGLSRRKFISRSAIGSLAIPFAKSNFNTENRAYKQVTSPQKTISALCLETGAANWDIKEYPQDKNVLLYRAYRGQSSILINNSILVDCGVTVSAALDICEVNVDAITDIVITHTHGDHFDIKSTKKIESKRSRQNKLNLWIEYSAASYFKTLEKDTGCAVKPVKCFESFSINEIEIMPVEANHFRARYRGTVSPLCFHLSQ